MPKRLRPILLALILTASAALYGCGSSGPDPSISQDSAQTLLSKIAEIRANVDVGSCLVAADKTDDLLSDIADLPSSVNTDVKEALDNGANNLKLLLSDPEKCEGHASTTTSTPSTTSTTQSTTSTTKTQPTTTTRTQTQTTPTQTQTTPTQTQTTPGGTSGGIGPGGL
ncbi:MAG TPA: hypothetical protein VGE91_00960 [Solirubrobacterales bacterium]|jgi:hypothetical protein